MNANATLLDDGKPSNQAYNYHCYYETDNKNSVNSTSQR